MTQKKERDPNEECAFCFDCGSVIPDQVAMKDIFLQAGKVGICPYCKGPMGVVPYGAVAGLREKRKRGEQTNHT